MSMLRHGRAVDQRRQAEQGGRVELEQRADQHTAWVLSPLGLALGSWSGWLTNSANGLIERPGARAMR